MLASRSIEARKITALNDYERVLNYVVLSRELGLIREEAAANSNRSPHYVDDT